MPITDRVRLLLLLILALVSGGLSAAPSPALRIGVMTMQPGEIFWERFGHDAIVVDDPSRGEPVSYNFGFFDPSEPDFVSRFIQGRMRYQLVALPMREDLAYYQQVGRGVSLQWLNLTPVQARRLADALAVNALPLGLAQGASVTRRIPKGDYLTYANCAPDERQRIVQVRREQDEWVRLAQAA